MDRFSEGLDFSLFVSNQDFDVTSYFPVLEKEKQNTSAIKSAFLKGNTIEYFLLFYPDAQIKGINSNDKIKIKFKVDIEPLKKAVFDCRYQLLPAPYEIVLYDDMLLFAGKIHAILCRSWKNRVKGRDL